MLQGLLHPGAGQGLRAGDGERDHARHVVAVHGHEVLRTVPVARLVAVEELPSDRVALVERVEPDPARELLHPHLAAVGELERGGGVPRRRPPDRVERLVHPEQTQSEPDVDDGVGVAGAQLFHRGALLRRHLGNRDLPGDAQARVDARAPTGREVLLADQRVLVRDPDATPTVVPADRRHDDRLLLHRPVVEREHPFAEHVLGPGHRDDGDLGQLLHVAAQRFAVLRDVRPEDDDAVFGNQLVERLAHRAEAAVREPLHGTQHEFDRALEHAALEEVVERHPEDPLHQRIDVLGALDVVDEQPDPDRRDIRHRRSLPLEITDSRFWNLRHRSRCAPESRDHVEAGERVGDSGVGVHRVSVPAEHAECSSPGTTAGRRVASAVRIAADHRRTSLAVRNRNLRLERTAVVAGVDVVDPEEEVTAESTGEPRARTRRERHTVGTDPCDEAGVVARGDQVELMECCVGIPIGSRRHPVVRAAEHAPGRDDGHLVARLQRDACVGPLHRGGHSHRCGTRCGRAGGGARATERFGHCRTIAALVAAATSEREVRPHAARDEQREHQQHSEPNP